MAETKIQPIKTDLFRFVTLRTPQLINGTQKSLWYIFHPDEKQSQILKNSQTGSIETCRASAKKAATSYKSAFTTPSEIKAKYALMYEFSQYLFLQKNKLDKGTLESKIATLETLNLKDLILLWDNLLYQVIVRSKPTVRQACIQLIRANYFVTFLKSQNIDDLTKTYLEKRKDLSDLEKSKYVLNRLANSKIVLSKCVTVGKETDDNEDNNDSNNIDGDIELNYNHQMGLTDYNLDVFKMAQSDLGTVKRKQNLKSNSVLKEIKLSDISKKLNLSKNTSSLINTHLSLNAKASVNDIEQKFNSQIVLLKNQKKKIELQFKKSKASTKSENRFAISGQKNRGTPGIYLSFALGKHKFITDSEYTVIPQTGKAIKGSDFESVSVSQGGNQSIFIPLNDAKELGDSKFDFSGGFTLNDGSKWNINTNVNWDKTTSFGNVLPSGTKKHITSSSPSPTPELFGVNRLGIGVYRKVEQEVCCYVPGEVSHIENILAREYKERHTRSLTSSETTTEETTEVEIEDQKDTVSTSRYELQSEISNLLNKDTSIGAGASLGASGTYMGVTITADGYFDYANTNASSESDSEAQTYAQEVTNTATERILQKTSVKRTSKILQEYEENNRHGFDNREGTQHVTGVYRWIDIIYTNRLINYGNRLMIEFLIPEPSKFYKKALAQKAAEDATETSVSSSLTAPVPLSEYGINSYEDIDENNYLEIANYYGISVDEPISPQTDVWTANFGPEDDSSNPSDPNADPLNYNFNMSFMTQSTNYLLYTATKVKVNYMFDYHLTGLEWGTYFKLFVHDESVVYDKDGDGEIIKLSETDGADERKSKQISSSIEVDLPNLTNSLDISVNIKNVWDFKIDLEVTVEVNEEEIITWQKAVYQDILNEYNAQLSAYESTLAEEEAATKAAETESESIVLSTDTCRRIEQREIERIAIEMLTKPFGIAQGRNFYYNGPCDVPLVKQNEQWELYSSTVKFFEQAFDWTLMAYLFYPYYWAKKCDWVELSQASGNGDTTFEGFLQSGMARVVIPVRLGFEEAVDHYMETGEIWNGGGLIIDMNDDLYISIDQELMEPVGFVEKEWSSRIPTTLTIVQGSSVYLEDEGLPCCDKIETSGVDTLLRGSTTILGTSTTTE
ncbi:MAG: hypothetical protein IM600_03860 [Bacteroidetes bacterium]|nr:hypothetical protein [Bacteroidota bacterium]MCA6442545.1 hypothetical protein [Bacteroidota bacterium]